jgi:fatty acid desaturase
MLEQIHADAEDQRKTRVIVALGMMVFGLYALASAAMGGWSAMATVGVMVGSVGAAVLSTVRSRATYATKRFAH